MWIKGDRGLERLQIANFHLEDETWDVEDKPFAKILL